MWIYEQKTGRLLQDDIFVAAGYSGKGKGKNNPDMQSVHNVGPIPVGLFTMQSPRHTESHGPYVIPLEPDDDNEMYGRSGFLCHGDSMVNPGCASEGCIIQARNIREEMWASGDHRVRVV